MPSHPGISNWQSQMPSRSVTPYWQPHMPSHPGTSNWQSQMPSHSGTQNLQTPILSHPYDAGLLNPNIFNQERREHHPNIYRQSPYMDLPPSIVLPKKQGDKTKNKVKNANVSPLNLGNAFADDNVGGDNVMLLGGQFTGNYLVYDNVDPSKTELLIRERPQDARWTMSKSGTVSVHPENKQFMIRTDQHIIETLDGSTRPYPTWKDIDWVYMPIHVAGNHWVTGAVYLPTSLLYVFDSMHSEGTKEMLSHQIKLWTPMINDILEDCGCFNGTRRQRHDFAFVYNDGLGQDVPHQPNFKDCGVITCWLISCLCSDTKPIVRGDSQAC
ncbi:phospholipase-like protein [Tanacetum coccineum]